jgi:hypothetical protein
MTYSHMKTIFELSSEMLCISSIPHGLLMAQAVSRRPLTTEVQVLLWVSSCGIFNGHSGTGTSCV